MAFVESKAPIDKTSTLSEPVPEGKDSLLQDSTEPRTVFSDSKNFNIKHPLHNAWTFWYDNPSKKKTLSSWSQNLKELVTVNTVEDFWGVFNNIAKPSELMAGANYHLFREGIKPEWEDPANANGGKWVVTLNKHSGDIDNLWMFTLLACIGEAFDVEDELCGAIFSSRSSAYRITLWTRSGENEDVALSIGRRFKETLSPLQITFEFSAHQDSKSKGSKLTL